MNKILGSYKNGNYKVILLDDGTKIRYNDLDSLIPDTVESMDIKITNQCDMGCKMCHENSTIDGKHGDIMGAEFINHLHPYTELAIGGGNPLSHPDLIPFLQKCRDLKLIPSMTVNQKHFMNNLPLLRKLVDEKLIYGLGISLNDINSSAIAALKSFENAVIHVINGLIKVKDLKKLKHQNLKVLILGYKEFRRGQALYSDPKSRSKIDANKEELKHMLRTIIDENWFQVVSFDNLALNQLNVKDLMSEKDWEEFYMGDDGIGNSFDSATMYIDLVERQFAKNSCDPVRFELLPTIEEMFNHLQTLYANK